MQGVVSVGESMGVTHGVVGGKWERAGVGAEVSVRARVSGSMRE